MSSINTLAKRALKITDAELSELEGVAREQLAYSHPLKNGTSVRQHRLGEYNLRVLTKVRELRDMIRAGAQLV